MRTEMRSAAAYLGTAGRIAPPLQEDNADFSVVFIIADQAQQEEGLRNAHTHISFVLQCCSTSWPYEGWHLPIGLPCTRC